MTSHGRSPGRTRRMRRHSWPLAIADLLVVAGFLALTRDSGGGLLANATREFVVAALMVGLFYLFGLYRARITLSALDVLPQLIVAAWVLAPVAALLLWDGDHPLLLFVMLCWPALLLLRIVYFAVQRRLRAARPERGSRTLVIGGGTVAGELVRSMLDYPIYGLRPVLVMDDDPLDRTAFEVEVIPRDRDLAGLIDSRGIETVIVAFSRDRDSTLIEPLRECDTLDCEIYVVPRLYEFVHQDRDMDRIHTTPLVLVRRLALRSSHWRIKRFTSTVTAVIGLIVLAPLLAVIAVAIKLERPSDSVLFRQTRVGQDGRQFTLYKFRTMRPVPDAESDQDWAPERITRFGACLRRHSLDELPQLWNVIRGDMSVVGPRPERPHFVDRFGTAIPAYHSRHRVKAGLTGWAAIHGLRGDTDIKDRASYDNYYIENWSLWLDTKILLLTVASVIAGKGH